MSGNPTNLDHLNIGAKGSSKTSVDSILCTYFFSWLLDDYGLVALEKVAFVESTTRMKLGPLNVDGSEFNYAKKIVRTHPQ